MLRTNVSSSLLHAHYFSGKVNRLLIKYKRSSWKREVSCDRTLPLEASWRYSNWALLKKGQLHLYCRFFFPFLASSPSPRQPPLPALILLHAPISLLGARLHSTLAPSMPTHLLLLHLPLHLLLPSLIPCHLHLLLHLLLLLPQHSKQGSQSYLLSQPSKAGHILLLNLFGLLLHSRADHKIWNICWYLPIYHIYQ